MNKVLIVAAHPDDEILGCGGTIAKHGLSGDEVYCLILSEGVTSRYEKDALTTIWVADAKQKKEEAAIQAANILGMKLYLRDFPDQQLDTIPLLEIVKTIEEVKDKVKPTIIYTHYKDDLNLDHRITFQACLTACRPLENETVKEIYSFEVPSSTEWGTHTFTPNVFVDISETFDKKIEALKCYESELRPYPHPRSLEAIKTLAMYRGYQSGLQLTEAFKLIRWIK